MSAPLSEKLRSFTSTFWKASPPFLPQGLDQKPYVKVWMRYPPAPLLQSLE